MKIYTKTIDGKAVIRPKNRIVVVRYGQQTINPTHDLLIEDGWTEYADPEKTEAQLLAEAISDKQDEITAYDSSPAVNVFRISGQEMWLDKATRAGLMLRFEAEKAAGRTETTLWYEGIQFPLPLDTAFSMLYALEVYASECYDNTQRHLAAVGALTDIEAVEGYGYREGYPAVLEF